MRTPLTLTRAAGLATAAGVAGAAGAAYGLGRLGSRYRSDAPLAGLAEFVATVRERARERERDLRDALGYEALSADDAAVGDGRGAAGIRTPEVAAPSLTSEQARELLRDPAGPTPRPQAAAAPAAGAVDEGAGI